MEKAKIIKELKTLKNKGECVSQTIILEEAIKLLEGSDYIVNKYSGRTYCGNGFFGTIDECVKFANDGFCTRAVIKDCKTGAKFTVRIEKTGVVDENLEY